MILPCTRRWAYLNINQFMQSRSISLLLCIKFKPLTLKASVNTIKVLHSFWLRSYMKYVSMYLQAHGNFISTLSPTSMFLGSFTSTSKWLNYPSCMFIRNCTSIYQIQNRAPCTFIKTCTSIFETTIFPPAHLIGPARLFFCDIWPPCTFIRACTFIRNPRACTPQIAAG